VLDAQLCFVPVDMGATVARIAQKSASIFSQIRAFELQTQEAQLSIRSTKNRECPRYEHHSED
jgi:hypothetical protein